MALVFESMLHSCSDDELVKLEKQLQEEKSARFRARSLEFKKNLKFTPAGDIHSGECQVCNASLTELKLTICQYHARDIQRAMEETVL